jgi:HK97 family phage major capsid protein
MQYIHPGRGAAASDEYRFFSPKETLRLADDFSASFRALLSRNEPKASLLGEVGHDLRRRAGLGDAPPGVLSIPTHAAMWQPAPLDRAAIARRDASVAGSGGYLVATQNVSFIELLRNRMVAMRMGATRLSGLVGNVTAPKQTAGATAYWLASETTAITEGNQTFAQMPLVPKTVGALTDISRLLQLQSSPDIDSVVARDLAAQVAIAADLAVIAGTGTEQPTGILNTGSIGTFTGTSLDLAALLNAQVDLASANALVPTAGYVTTPAVAALLMTRQAFAGPTGDALWQGSPLDGTVAGLRAMSSAQMPSATMILGDWSQVVIGEWGVLEISVSNNAEPGHFAKGITSVRALYTMDVGVRHAAAFSVATSIT